ncbi:MAG: hypothetical protein IH987_14910 [Planctomycetes bacterium]|nr:hypothetical protein [Planctomycetota bacterium]
MSKLQTRTWNPSEYQSQERDDTFAFVSDLSETAPPQPRSSPSGPFIVEGSLADSTMAISTFTVFFSVVDERSSAPPSEVGEPFLSAEQAQFIRELAEDRAQLPLKVRSSDSAKLCWEFVSNVGIALANARAIRCAIFGDEEDGVTFVAHSGTTKRQVSFEFGEKTPTVTIVKIDHQMHRVELDCRIHHELTLGNAVSWLSRC